MSELLEDKMKAGFEAAGERMQEIECSTKELQDTVLSLHKQCKAMLVAISGSGGYSPENSKAFFVSEEQARLFGKAVAEVFRGRKEKDLGGSQGALGGYATGDDMVRRIIELMSRYGKFRANAQRVEMRTSRLIAPKISQDLAIFVPGEGQQITASDVKLGQVQLNARTLAAFTVLSRELDEDEIIGLAEVIARSLTRSMAKKEDEVGFLGDGTDDYHGMTGITGAFWKIDSDQSKIAGLKTGTGNAYSELALGDFEETVGLLPPEYDEDAKWYLHKRFYYNVILPLARAAGVANFLDIISDRKARYFLGYEIEFVHCMPYEEANSQICAILGDLSSGAYLGERKELSIERSDHILFQNYQVGIRGVERADINAFGCGDGTNPGPIVGLVTAAS